jgi:hypothetical protein
MRVLKLVEPVPTNFTPGIETSTFAIILDTVRPRDTPPTGLVQENVYTTMKSVMVEMIVLTALMKDKSFVLHVIVMRNLEDMVALDMVRIWVHFL